MSKKFTYTISSDLRHLKAHISSLAEEMQAIIEESEASGLSPIIMDRHLEMLDGMHTAVNSLRVTLREMFDAVSHTDVESVLWGQIPATATTNGHGKAPYAKEG